MKLEYRNGLLFASIDIVFRGRRITVHDVIIDTGAVQTILSADAVEAFHIRPEAQDEIVIMQGIEGGQGADGKYV